MVSIVGEVEVSTVDLRTTIQNWPSDDLDGPYETCLFLGGRGSDRGSEVVQRYRTKAEALAGHALWSSKSEDDLLRWIV